MPDGPKPARENGTSPWPKKFYLGEPVPASERRPEWLDPIDTYGNTHAPESYGGQYVDGGTIYVGFVSDGDQHLQRLREIVSDPLRAFSVARSLAELTSLEERVTADWEQIATVTGGMYALGINVEDNVVEIYAKDAGPTALAWVRARYGDGVEVIRSGPVPAA